MTLRLDIAQLEASIAALLVQFPELAEDDDFRADVLEGETTLHEVLAALLDRERADKAMVEAIAARERDLSARKARFKHRQEAWRVLIQQLMEHAGLRKCPLPEATLSISFNKPKPVIVDESLLPEMCTITVRKPDAIAIREWCAANDPPPGVVMSNGYDSLRILPK